MNIGEAVQLISAQFSFEIHCLESFDRDRSIISLNIGGRPIILMRSIGTLFAGEMSC